MKKLLRLGVTLLCVWGLLTATGLSTALSLGRAPGLAALSRETEGETATEAGTDTEPAPVQTEEDRGLPFLTERQDGAYTILLAGNDAGTGNTDTIMLGKIDTINRRMDFVSIPRDCYLPELSWTPKKLNSVYWTDRLGGGDGIGALEDQLEKLCGFRPDCYAVVELTVLEQAVDLMGGLDFDLPMDMDYEDPLQDLHIHLKAGPQHLTGKEAMELCRYRSGYVTGDIGRIQMQQAFLSAAAEQLTDLGKIPNLPRVAALLAQGSDTDLTASNLIWLLRQALRCGAENLHFYTAPHEVRMIDGYSYALLDDFAWRRLLEEHISPLAPGRA